MSHASFDSLEEKLAQAQSKFGSAEINVQRSSSSSPTHLYNHHHHQRRRRRQPAIKAQFDEDRCRNTDVNRTCICLALSSQSAGRWTIIMGGRKGRCREM